MTTPAQPHGIPEGEADAAAALPAGASPDEVRAYAAHVTGFMPVDEGDFLYAVARDLLPGGPGLEIGTWCGKSAVILGAAARAAGSVVFTLDHHRGSEENQAGWEWHDTSLVDPEFGLLDTLPTFRRSIARAGLEDEVVAVVGRSRTVARYWRTPLALLFIDGGHAEEHVIADYEGFARWVGAGGVLVFHDIFEHPQDGGQAPWRVYRRALESGGWAEVGVCGSMRALRRVRGDTGDPV